jgi:transposase-like protein
MHPETLRTWVRQYEREQGKKSGPLAADERARLKELERRNRELEMENAFLKKAAAYFARDPVGRGKSSLHVRRRIGTR